MTHTLHRQGTLDSLGNDYVIFATTAKGITREGSAPKIKEFMRICLKYHPVNMGNGKDGNMQRDDVDIERLISNQGDGAGVWIVYTDLDDLEKAVKELIQANLGLSINVSGLLDGVRECCRKTGIERHSVEQSLGVWGARDRLPLSTLFEK
jgi:hypothetical protein